MIILITGWFPKYDRNGYETGEKEFIVSHGYDTETGKTVITSCDHPARMGGVFNSDIGEWVIV